VVVIQADSAFGGGLANQLLVVPLTTQQRRVPKPWRVSVAAVIGSCAQLSMAEQAPRPRSHTNR